MWRMQLVNRRFEGRIVLCPFSEFHVVAHLGFRTSKARVFFFFIYFCIVDPDRFA